MVFILFAKSLVDLNMKRYMELREEQSHLLQTRIFIILC